MTLLRILVLCLTALSFLPAAVGLVTVPERDVVRMTIYNAVDLTLVQETRTLILKKGINRIQYQWAGTLIDATSLQLRCLDKAADTEILGIIYPPNAPATLQWEVESNIEGTAKFEISYFTSGLTWNADYVLRANPDETKAEVEGWVAVSNNSGEHYPRAEVRLVVGSINLIEQIRDLATGQLYERRKPAKIQPLSNSAIRKALERTEGLAADERGEILMKSGAPEVVSARLGDYHIFTVSGVQSVTNGATSRFQAITTKEPMGLEVLYRVGFMENQAVKLYRFINDKAHELPEGPLPDGTWHVFRVTDVAQRTLSFSGETHSAYVPPDQKVELNLGVDPSIAVLQTHEWHGETDHHYNNNGRVDGFNTHDRYRFKLVNTKTIPISLEYLVDASGQWSIDGLTGERRDANTYRHQAQIPAGEVLELGPFTISVRSADIVAEPKAPDATTLPPISLKP